MTETQNVDPEEIKKFSDLASRWWDFEGEFKPLHDLNPLRLDYISDKSNGLFEKNVLDVGCGGGILSESMARKGATVSGIDLAADPLAVAKLHALETGVKINYQKIAVEQKASESPAAYDVVTCMEMLEHVPDPASVIQACCDLVKPGGTVYFSTINKTWKAYLMMIVGAEHVLKWVPKGTHEYEKFIRPSQLLGAIDRTQLKCDDLCGVEYSPLSNDFKITKNVDVNYMLKCTKVI